MFITVTCPKCGRSIKAKKKFALAAGGVPCLKCKIRIPLTPDQIEAAESTDSETLVKTPSGPIPVPSPQDAPEAMESPSETGVPPSDASPAPEPTPPKTVLPSEAESVTQERSIPTVFAPLHESSGRQSETIPADTAVSPEAIPQGVSAMILIADLRKKLAEAEERAHSAELALQQLTKEKATSEIAAVRRIRELEGQVKELAARLKAREEEYRVAGLLKRSDVAALLQNLNAALDENFRQEVAARQSALDDLKRQLAQMLPH
jgi:hypothetical protein